MEVINWLVQNANLIGVLLMGLHGVAVAVVNLTPTPCDNLILGRVYKVVEALAGIFTMAAKEPPGARNIKPSV